MRDPNLGGGSLLDVGVYPIALAQLVFGPLPEAISATCHVVRGVDEQLGAVLRFPGGGLALIASALEVETSAMATIDGTEGRITIPDFWRATTASLETPSGTEHVELPTIGGGWAHQVLHVHSLLREGRLESPLVTHESTIARARICDSILAAIGVTHRRPAL